MYLEPQLSQLQQFVNDMGDAHRAEENTTIAKDSLLNRQVEAQNNRDQKEQNQKQAEQKVNQAKEGYPSVVAICIAIGVVLLGLMEGLLSINAIRTFIPNRIIAVLIALVFGCGIALLAHKFPKWWNLGTSRF